MAAEMSAHAYPLSRSEKIQQANRCTMKLETAIRPTNWPGRLDHSAKVTGIVPAASVLGGPSRILSQVETLPELETLRVVPSTDLTSSMPSVR
jgi:hypothetical protein